MKLLIDAREPEPHPWLPDLPHGWEVQRATLETGDLALAAMPEAAVVERKTPSDLVAGMTSARERFERELKRSRYLGRFVVVIEGSLQDRARGSHGGFLLAKWRISRKRTEMFDERTTGLSRAHYHYELRGQEPQRRPWRRRR